MAPPKNPSPSTYHLCLLLLSTTTLSAGVSTYSSRCSSPSPASDSHTNVDDALLLIRSFQLSTGYFSGGGDSLFSPDDDRFNPRSFSFVPHRVSHTTDPTLFHLTATLTLSGPRSNTYQGRGRRRRRRRHRAITQSVSFVLDGYYSSASLELCMVGTGTEFAADGSIKHYADVALHLHVPRPSSLIDPFVTGRLHGADFETISLVAYAEGDSYKYSESISCPPMQPAAAASGRPEALGVNFSCAHLKEQLISSYRLKYGSANASSTSPLLRLHELRMHVNQMQCTVDGAVRAYVVFSNDTEKRWYYHQHHFSVKEEAIVADGHWDSAQSMLCLRACRVARSGPYLEVHEHECKIGMGFWFPAVFTIQDRSIVAGMLWERQGTGNNDAGLISGVISASSIDDGSYRSNLSDVKYNYTMVEEAKKHYLNAVLSENKKKIKGSFPGNYTFHDFELHFFVNRDPGSGQAYPVTIGSAMVYGDRLAADDSFSRHAVVDMKNELLNVSYDIRHWVPPADWQRPKNGSYSVALEERERQISAEGVYDPKTGILCMIGCREVNSSTDCQILVTVQFASLDAKAQGHGRGAISSLRDKTDPLFFEKIDITLIGMYTEQVSEAISRMDLESIMLVFSTTLSCVFTVLQILHTKRNHEAPPATSITMLVLLALGYVAPLVLNFEALFTSRRKQYFPFSRNGWLELNEVMLRAPMLIALVLQLRLLQLAWSGRRSADRSKAEMLSAAERKALRICLPLYLLGGVLAGIVHVINARAARENPLVVRIAPEPATLWDDLVPYAGLILDAFLLPQVILNVFSGSRVRAISPWFYVGFSMIRAMPHVYDVIRAQNYVPSLSPSYMYASPRDDLFSVAWDVVIPCGAAFLALLLFLQQRIGGAFLVGPRRRSGEYEMVSSL